MDIIYELQDIIDNSMLKANEILSKKISINPKEEVVLRKNQTTSSLDNLLYHADNTECILDLVNRGYKESIDLIYIDPPFYTMTNYNNRVEIYYNDKKEVVEYMAYTDTWKNGFKEYLEMITVRLILMKELLSDKGTIYVHIDFRTVHYIKIIMDKIFGIDNFLNEVIWSYKSGGTSQKYFSRKHDNILVYTKTKNYIFNPQKEKSYNRGFKPYGFKGVKEYQDNLGWHTLVNLKDVWQIDMVGRTSGERVGYDTQKPMSLLERIILSSSNEESIVADFFAGSGTTLAVAEKNNRKWIGSDMGSTSLLTITKRLAVMKSKAYKKIYYKAKNEIGDILLRVVNKEIIEEATYLFSIFLERYIMDIDELKLKKSNYALISDILYNDSLALIDYVSIIVDKEVSTVIYEDYRLKNKNRINNEIVFTYDSIKFPIYIEIVDIFGNRIRKEIS